MKLSYRLKIGLIIILIASFFLVLNLTPFGKEIKNFFYLISSPIQKIFWKTGNKISDFFEVIFRIKDLKRENEELKLKIQTLEAENVTISELKKENEILREALEIGLEKEFGLQLAQVIGKDVSQDLILINKGLKDGILEGFPVISQQKLLIGKISEVYKDFSKVLLISNPKSSFDAKIADSDIFGVVKGKGNLKILFDFIPQEKEIKEGDLVVTSVLGGIFPQGLLVGKINEVTKSDLKPFQKAQIQPVFNIGNLEKLFIITEW
ncbi:MAG: rod shape-determining protein MreC [Patescibacteria group bacterium]|nr:rod shape-determining protein MreC [Patescibacteria group bacterium]